MKKMKIVKIMARDCLNVFLTIGITCCVFVASCYTARYSGFKTFKCQDPLSSFVAEGFALCICFLVFFVVSVLLWLWIGKTFTSWVVSARARAASEVLCDCGKKYLTHSHPEGCPVCKERG